MVSRVIEFDYRRSQNAHAHKAAATAKPSHDILFQLQHDLNTIVSEADFVVNLAVAAVDVLAIRWFSPS
jgi:hypothetical protein